MSITRNASIEQLWYTWSTTGYGSTNGFRIRKISAGLDVNSARVKSMDRFLRYTLPPGYDSFSTSPEQAPISLSLLNTEVERVLIYKTYRGKDLVGRPGNFFAHLLAGLPSDFTAHDAIDLWRSNFWQMTDTNDQDVVMRPASGDDLMRASRTSLDISTLPEPLTSLILAYITRQPQQRIYLIADSSDIVAALISGLTRGLPEQILQGLTFSTYEADVTRASTQIVGTCLRVTSDRDARAEQTLLAHCRRDGLLLDCRRPSNNSPLEQETFAAHFAKFVAESVAYNEMDQINDLYMPMQRMAQIDIHELLNEYKHVIEDAQQLSPEKVEFYLSNERYALRKLSDATIREAIINFAASDPSWWTLRLKPIMLHLKQQGLPQYADPLFRIARRGIKVAVGAMKTSASMQDEAVLTTMLDMMSTLEPPVAGSEVWIKLLEKVGESLLALQFLALHWTYTSQLLTTWSSIQPYLGALDGQIKPLLWIQWPNYEHLLQLALPLTWKAIATEQLLNDATQRPDDRSILRLGNAGTQQAVEEVLTFCMNTPSLWTTATRLILLLIEQRFPFSKACDDLVIHYFQQLLEDRQSWNWAMLLRDALRRTYKAEDVLYLVVRSSTGRVRAQEQADSLLQNAKEQAAFLEKRGPQLLTDPATADMVITLFGRLAREHYAGKMALLFSLLDKIDDVRLGELLNVARLTPDEVASVLKSYGKRSLRSSMASPVMLGLFDELVRNGYPRKIEVLAAFFQNDVSPATLEEFLVRAQLNTVNDAIAFHTHIGTWYITQNPRSSTMVHMLELLASYNYSKKMDLVFAWLDAKLDDQILSSVLQQALLQPEEKVTVLTKYGYTYLSPPYSSRAMLDLYIETLRIQPSNKLALVGTALSAQINETGISSVLEAARLTTGNGGPSTTLQEIKDLFEQYGSKFLQFSLQSPALLRRIDMYLQDFTFDDLTRKPAKDLIHTLYQFMYSSSPERLRSWYTISHYLEQPDSAGLKDFLQQAFKYGTPISTSGVFYTWLVQMCHTLASQNADMGYLIPAVNSAFKGLDNKGLDKIQLLYAMADCAAQDYNRLHREDILLPYIYFLPQARQVCSIPSEESMRYFTVVLLNTLLTCSQPETVENLNTLLSNRQIGEWQIYYKRHKGHLTATKIEVASSSHIGRLKNFFVYNYAYFRLQQALLSKKPRKIARIWNSYQIVLEMHADKIGREDRQHIEQAQQFFSAYEANEEASIVSLFNQMDNEGYFRFTKQERKDVTNTGNSLMRNKEQAKTLPQTMQNTQNFSNNQAQEMQAKYHQSREDYHTGWREK